MLIGLHEVWAENPGEEHGNPMPKKVSSVFHYMVGVTLLSRLSGTPVSVYSAVTVIQPNSGKRDYVEIAAHLCMGLAVEADNVVIALGFL